MLSTTTNMLHATLEIDADTLKVLQLHGFSKSKPNNTLKAYVLNWLESEKQRLQLQAKVARKLQKGTIIPFFSLYLGI